MTERIDETSMSYEQARDELISVVQRLESGGVPLAESLALWERGEQLAALCQSFLDGARAKMAAARPAHTDPADPAKPEP
jgi:exodeoxyribonuclease VII small subunit